MTIKKPKIIAIVGATASGKTALSLALAKQFSGEIISADSRQVYRGLDIGTAKITNAEMAGVPHHLIDIRNTNEVYTAHEFKIDATTAVEAITERNHLPIIVGGTFFYLDTLRGRTGGAPVPPNPELRLELEAKTLPELQAMLKAQDPKTALIIDTQNPRRIIRALEILVTLGHIPETKTEESPYDWLIIGLQADKATLRVKYRERAAAWLKQGFLLEIRNLLEADTSRARLQEFGFEYSLGLALLEGKISETEFIDRFEQKNWQYAKRQITWLKRDAEVKWFDSTNQSRIQATVESFLAN